MWPDRESWKGSILFLETSEEAPSPESVQRMLRALGACGVLSKLSAILFGRPGGHQNRVKDELYDDALTRVVRDELGLNYPIVSGMDFGHTDPIMTLPIGIEAELDCESRTFRIVEAAVR
jgi:muramoyltetrapeptide carboxypeptidase LdcA involved in peptidoglycan recycling